MILYNLYERIPADWMGLGFGSLLAWLFFRFIDRSSYANKLRDMISSALLVYIVASRFVAGLVLHFNLSIRNDILSALNGSSAYGWLFGTLGVTLYILMTINAHKELQTDELYSKMTSAVLLVSLGFFAYLAVISLYPFRMQAALRVAALFFLILLATRLPFKDLVQPENRRRKAYTLNPFRTSFIWIALGVWFLATSLLVPQAVLWLWFSPAQWWFITIIFVSWLYSKTPEARETVVDIESTAASSQASAHVVHSETEKPPSTNDEE